MLGTHVTQQGEGLNPVGRPNSPTSHPGARGRPAALPRSPVQSQGVQESGKPLHDQKDGYGQDSKYGKNDEDPDEPSPAAQAQADVHHHGPEHFGQFCKTQEQQHGFSWQMQTIPKKKEPEITPGRRCPKCML